MRERTSGRERLRSAQRHVRSGISTRTPVVPTVSDAAVLPRHRSSTLLHRLTRLRPYLGSQARERTAAIFQEQTLLGLQRAAIEGVRESPVESYPRRGHDVEESGRGEHAGYELYLEASDENLPGHTADENLQDGRVDRERGPFEGNTAK